MLFLFSVVFGTLGVALGKVSTACPAWCVFRRIAEWPALGQGGHPFRLVSPMPRMTAEGGEGSILLRQGPGFRARWRFVVITADHHLIERLADTLPGSRPRHAPRPSFPGLMDYAEKQAA
jgi:hypothetical protein